MSFYLYILESLTDDSFYVGSIQDLRSRIERHNEGGVKSTRAKRPWKIAYFEKHPDRSSTMKREYAVKRRKSKEFIETLVRASRQK
jgi:putative endonuclease